MYNLKHNGKLIQALSEKPRITYYSGTTIVDSNGASNAPLRVSSTEIADKIISNFKDACAKKGVKPPIIKIYDEKTGEDMNPDVVPLGDDGFRNPVKKVKKYNWNDYAGKKYPAQTGYYNQSVKDFSINPVEPLRQAWETSEWRNIVVKLRYETGKISITADHFTWYIYPEGGDLFIASVTYLPSEDEKAVLEYIKTTFFEILEKEEEAEEWIDSLWESW